MVRACDGLRGDWWCQSSNLSAVVLYPKKILHHWTMNFTESTAWTVYFNILPWCYEEENKTGGNHWASLDPLVLLLFRFCHCSLKDATAAQKLAAASSFPELLEVSWPQGRTAPLLHPCTPGMLLGLLECHQYCSQCLSAQDLALSVQVQISQMQTKPLALKVSTEAFCIHSAGSSHKIRGW